MAIVLILAIRLATLTFAGCDLTLGRSCDAFALRFSAPIMEWSLGLPSAPERAAAFSRERTFWCLIRKLHLDSFVASLSGWKHVNADG